MIKLLNKNRLFFIVFSLLVMWELYIMVRLPKQAWVEGLLESWYTSKGLVFYKDFINQYPPFLHMLMVPYHKIFGFTQTPTLVLAPLNSILIIVILSIASFRWLKGKYRVLPILFFVFWDPVLSMNHFSTAAFHELVNLLAFVLWLAWYKKESRSIALIIGFLLSSSLFSMHISVFFVCSIFLTFIFKPQSFLFALIGFLLPPFYIFIWFLKHNALYELYWWNLVYYLKYYPYTNLGRGLVNTVTFLAVFSPLLFAVRSKVSPVVILILISLPLSIWFAIFHPIRFQIALPIYAFVFGWGLEKMSKMKQKKYINRALILLVLVLNIASFYYYMFPFYKSSFAYRRDRSIITKLYSDDPMYEAVNWIKDNTPDDAKLFVMADPMFHIETNRLPVSARGTMNQPFTYEPLDTLGQELDENPPDYWIVDERLVNERFPQFGYEHTKDYFNKLLLCEPGVARMEYITIRKHVPGKKLCLGETNDY